MKTFKIPVTWQMIADIEIEANSLEGALEQISQINVQEKMLKGTYVKHSFEVQEDFLEQDE